ncbi:MAG: helix-turn-helix domain-containing protein [Ktedonobacteraceae bacterium]
MSDRPPIKTYTIKELAQIFQKNEETIRRWIRSGELPATKIGGSYYIEEETLRRILRGNNPQD